MGININENVKIGLGTGVIAKWKGKSYGKSVQFILLTHIYPHQGQAIQSSKQR